MEVLIVKDVMILEMTDSTLIVTNPVGCAHCARFSTSNPDVIIVNKELIHAQEIAKMELLNVISVVNKISKYVRIGKTLKYGFFKKSPRKLHFSEVTSYRIHILIHSN